MEASDLFDDEVDFSEVGLMVEDQIFWMESGIADSHDVQRGK